jgi:hypothetical protein
MAKRLAAKNNQEWDVKQERAPLEVCLDPQFEIYKQFIVQKNPEKIGKSIYDEVDPEVFLKWYGNAFPPRIVSWTLGPAKLNRRFQD